MATTNKYFKVKNGLDVNSNATVDASGNANISGNLTANSGFVSANTFRLDTSFISGSSQTGELAWNPDEGTIEFAMKDGDVVHRIGQEMIIRVVNNTGSTITEGSVVYISGSSGQQPQIALANASTESASTKTIGLVTQNGGIANGADGYICMAGIMRGVNVGAYTAGTALWLANVAGTFTSTKPVAPDNGVFLGWVIKEGSAGSILVHVQNGYELEELHNVLIDGTPSDNEILTWDLTSGLWKNQTAEEANIANTANTGTVTFLGNVTVTSGKQFNGNGAGLTDIPISTGVSGLGTNIATFLATPTSTNLDNAITDDSGSGPLVFANTASLYDANITASANTVTALTVTGATNQTSTPIFRVISSVSGGLISATDNGVTLGSSASIFPKANSGYGLYVAQRTGQTGNLIELRSNNSTTVIAAFDANANLTAPLITSTGNVNATTFNGSGAGLRSLNAANINSNTVVTLNATNVAATNVNATTVLVSGDANVAGKLSVTASSGDEGGEIFLNKATTNTTINGGVTIDVYQNKIRFFEQGGTARGAYIDLTAAGAGVGSNLLAGGSADGNTTYDISAVTTTGGALLRLTASNPSGTDDVKFANGDGIAVAYTDASTITITPNIASATVNGIVTIGTQTFAGDKTFSNISSSTLRLTSTTDVTNVSTTHAFQIGADNSANLRIDTNEIHALNNGAYATLLLNELGGDVNVGATTSTVTVAGNAQLGLAEKQIEYNTGTAGSSTAGGYVYANNTHYVNVSASNYFANITAQRVYPTGWSQVDFATGGTLSANTLTVSGIFTSVAEGDIVLIFASTENGSQPTTSSAGWTTQSSGSTTYAATIFWKRMGATPDTSMVLTFTGSTTPSSYVAKVFRPTGITPSLSTAVVTVQTTNWAVGTTTTPNPDSITTVHPNAIAVTAISVENTNSGGAATVVPTGYSNTASGLNERYSYVSSTSASYSAMTWKTTPIAAAGTAEDASAWTISAGTGGGTPAWSATTFLIQAYIDPIINIMNTSFLSSGLYNASTYVLHINNAENRTVTWSGPTFAWQGGTAPTLSSSAPNNIIILETINGTTFRGALLDNYA